MIDVLLGKEKRSQLVLVHNVEVETRLKAVVSQDLLHVGCLNDSRQVLE